jgi:hypothetical protein
LVDEIAAASKEQASGINQVNTAVAEMDKITQSTVASAEESAATSEELNAQAEQMKVFVGDLEAFYEIVTRNPHGMNRGIDLSSGMLEKAKKRVSQLIEANYSLDVVWRKFGSDAVIAR